LEGDAPAADAGEEVALPKPGKIGGINVADIPLIDDPRRDVSRSDEFSQPSGGVRIVFVVIDTAHRPATA